MIGRQLIDAMRRETPALPPSVPKLQAPPVAPQAESGLDKLRDANDRIVAGPGPAPRWPVLGYAVARWDEAGRKVLTHTSLMPYSEAQREADAQRKADQHGYSWAVVEIRSAT